MVGRVHKWEQLLQSGFCIAVEAYSGGYNLIEFALVDIDVNNLGLRSEAVDIACNAVAEAHTHSYEHVAIGGGYVASHIAVHANHTLI